MRFDQIEDFNKACADVAELAAKAIEEHRRQLDELGTIVREARTNRQGRCKGPRGDQTCR